jgi:hypothetical protein
MTIEAMIERWSDSLAGDQFRWSLWIDGRRVAMGGPVADAKRAEAEARQASHKNLGRAPDRVSVL